MRNYAAKIKTERQAGRTKHERGTNPKLDDGVSKKRRNEGLKK
jgi:hypothetical protein